MIQECLSCSRSAAIIFDESTSNTTDKMLVCILIVLTESGDVKSIFLGIPKIEKGDASTVHQEIEKILKDMGLEEHKVMFKQHLQCV